MLHKDIRVIRQIDSKVYERGARSKLCVADTCQGGKLEYKIKGFDDQELYGNALNKFKLIMKY